MHCCCWVQWTHGREKQRRDFSWLARDAAYKSRRVPVNNSGIFNERVRWGSEAQEHTARAAPVQDVSEYSREKQRERERMMVQAGCKHRQQRTLQSVPSPVVRESRRENRKGDSVYKYIAGIHFAINSTFNLDASMGLTVAGLEGM